MKELFRFLSAIRSFCNYTILGRKVVWSIRKKGEDNRVYNTEKDNKFLARTKMGRNIALIGVFCPFFWVALFSEVRGKQLYLQEE